MGALGEYGANQYRLNGTLGYSLSSLSQFKASIERFGQRLPFQFDSGTIDARVHQMAYGGRFQHALNYQWAQGLNAGGYWALANNKDLNPILFTSNGINCAGTSSTAGLTCINYSHLAGAQSKGLDAGIDFLFTPATLVKTNIYYDQVHYRTLFTPRVKEDRTGLGVGVKLDQLISEHVKILAEASVREIYDSYQAGFSLLPPWKLNAELSLLGQHLVSHNATANNNSFALNLSFLGDEAKHYETHHHRDSTFNDLTQWIRTPAVKMNQVLIIADQLTKLMAPSILNISPNNGPLAGGNTVIISGTNFIEGLLVYFSGQLATQIKVLSSTRISVLVPPLTNPANEVVDILIQNPDGQQSLLTDGYTYTGGGLPLITSISPNQVSSEGGTLVTILGENLSSVLSVTFGDTPGEIIERTDTQILVLSPANSEGVTSITVTTAAGSVTSPDVFTYTAPPVITSSPTNQSIAEGDSATFSAAATGTPTPTVQWQSSTNGTTWTNISGANSTSYTVSNALLSDNGLQYRAIFTNNQGQAQSNAATLTVTATTPSIPKITQVVSNTGPISEGGSTNDPKPVINGTAPANSSISIYDNDGTSAIGTTTAADNGNWSFTPTTNLTDGPHSITATATKNGSTSAASVAFTFTVDTQKPNQPSDLAINSQGNVLTGSAEAGTSITVKDPNGNTIGSTTVDEQGHFTVTLNPAQTNGETLNVTATDAAGNQSTPASVTAPDNTPPEPPANLLINDEGTTLTGTAEVGSTITVRDSDGNILGTATTEANGNFSVTLTPAQTAGQVLTVTATDAAGNQSTPASVTAPDNTPPEPPTNLLINDEGTTLTGTAEVGSTITVRDSDGNVLGTATTEANGNFSVTLTPAQTAGQVLTVTATDAAGQ